MITESQGMRYSFFSSSMIHGTLCSLCQRKNPLSKQEEKQKREKVRVCIIDQNKRQAVCWTDSQTFQLCYVMRMHSFGPPGNYSSSHSKPSNNNNNGQYVRSRSSSRKSQQNSKISTYLRTHHGARSTTYPKTYHSINIHLKYLEENRYS